jgi:translation initiation factor 1
MLRPHGPRYLRQVAGGGRLVYATGIGSICPRCGWPARACRCSTRVEEPVPSKVNAVLRLEKKGRAGKSVTVVDGLPRNASFVARLAKELKAALGTGGTAKEGCVEIQGDHRERLRALLRERGFLVKG